MASTCSPLLRATKEERKEPRGQKSEKKIAAIDFGTSAISLAYQKPGKNPKTIPLFATFERVPNALLVQINKETQEHMSSTVGQDGQTTFNNLTENKMKRTTYVYFERIKMLLKENEVSRITRVFYNLL